MSLFLLDSSVLIDLLHGKGGQDELVRDLVLRKHRLVCCSITMAELYAGILPKDAPKLDKLFRSLEYFEISPEAARRAGLERAQYRRKGKTLTLADALLAALALDQDMYLVTSNRRDFPMPDLKLYPPPQAN